MNTSNSNGRLNRPTSAHPNRNTYNPYVMINGNNLNPDGLRVVNKRPQSA